MSVELQPAYVLHTRPYRDTSMLVDFFTPHYGRVTAVARGVRSRKATKRNLLNPFTRLLISFQGKTDLKLLTHFEATGAHYALMAKHLFSGFYLNELLVRLLPELDPHQVIFALYEQSLHDLHMQADLEPVLRLFEFQLLQELGYGIDFEFDAKSSEKMLPESYYCLDAGLGFFQDNENLSVQAQYLGRHLLAISQSDFSQADVKQSAKRISRTLLKPLLGARPLTSRELFN